MPVVTINGPVGSGAKEIGSELARLLGADYVDRLILAEAAKKMRATVAALVEKEERPITLKDRLARSFQRMLERSALTGTGADPFFGVGVDAMMTAYYPEAAREEPIASAQELNDLLFFQTVSGVIKDIAKAGNVVIVGRGSNIILRNMIQAFHVGLVADWATRVRTIQGREHLDEKAAERFVLSTEKARANFYRLFLKVELDNPKQYHMVLNTQLLDFPVAARVAAQAAKAYQEQVDRERKE
ncbi:MAG: cytidylate kinase-like family protein [Chloroflexi bacterium]|nr:cytidylate kinase-like family protein [Chloroflexota bacterium]